MLTADTNQTAAREKQIVAMSSVAAAVLLTGTKLGVGLATGSLGILSEAAHSGLDLVAAVVTWFAVRASSRPADSKHSYGHGKVENLSALFETLLLLGTCAWIIVEAVERLLWNEVEVEPTAWAFVVMLGSIGVDVSRSRALARVAHKYRSQALEADALHFSTDIWSSLVVLVGLVLLWLGERIDLPWFRYADTVAALGVAGIVVWVSLRLGRKTVADLLDEVPPGLSDEVAAALHQPGVVRIGRVRVRRSGPEAFVDATLCVEADTSLGQSHAIADAAEREVQRILPGADVMIHVEPASDCETEFDLPNRVRQIALEFSLRAHDLLVHGGQGQRTLELHIEVDESLDVGAAHDLASAFERRVRDAGLGLDRVVTHIEPAHNETLRSEPARMDDLAAMIAAIAREQDGCCEPHNIEVFRLGEELHASLHCHQSPSTRIAAAHGFSERLERALFERIPSLNRVTIHIEPSR